MLFACKSTKQSTQPNLTFRTLSAPIRTTLQLGNGKEMSVDGQMKIVRNEAIQLSFRIPILGTEAARVVITPTDVLVINRLNQQYVSESFVTLQNQSQVHLNYADVENLLTGKNTLSNIQCEYFDWKGDFPMRIQVAKTVENKRYGAIVVSKSVDFDADFSIDTSIPKNYRQITLQQFIASMANFKLF
ncbi:hypothetical protein FACS1894176_03400 [Bacteroidia bacterium]|nr:hypothetical protein FACS1894176_03400 [Bacteroidia bacterium]